ncbi:winged helix-turn-helix transcriptional regulator [Streptomyces phaeolivaceus]|uniref:Winged helix-turn-helix transcriptional regulator n=1 Tax=Streptomyces phaeolivaceus TaxID=2653200 RepID=A0A5P8JZC3_9ACTN|nr:helix-turn-helix domain-containing protein [Streptomyces phaeolivaceus]QFQ96060.1 winged helix-turn-helix transcriptional regulator [Streptomyces phaeolivaceus]
MLRIHFTDADLARVQVASRPDPLWEIYFSLHRLQGRRNLRPYEQWHRTTRQALQEKALTAAVREVLLPLYPRGSYFPDFLTPGAAAEGLQAGLEAILSAPRSLVQHEIGMLARVRSVPSWTRRLADTETRGQLVETIRVYHGIALLPHRDLMQAHHDADRSLRARALLDDGTGGLLAGLGPCIRWLRPTLEVDYPVDRDLHLRGRGLTLIPSYFCRGTPVALADPDLPPVLVYPLRHQDPDDGHTGAPASPTPLRALIGATRAAILRASATGATTGELARLAGVSAASATRHTTVLRNSGLLLSRRHGPSVLHTLTPAGTTLLNAEGGR